VGFIPFGDAIPVGLPDGGLGLTEGEQDLTISSSGDIVLMSEEQDPINNNGDSPEDLDSGEAQYGGFAFNRDGGMLVPGYGWVYPDDPNWGDWLDLHNSLQGLPISYATAILDIVAEMFVDEEPLETIIFAIAIFIICLFLWPAALPICLVLGVVSGVDAWVYLTLLWGPLGFVLGIPFGTFICLLFWGLGIFFPFAMALSVLQV